MTFKAKDVIVSPSKQKRVDEFIKLMDSNPTARKALLKSTRSPLCFMPKSTLNKLDDPKKAEKELNFKAIHNLDDMVKDAWNYQKNN